MFKKNCLVFDRMTWYRLQHIKPNTKNMICFEIHRKGSENKIILNILGIFHPVHCFFQCPFSFSLPYHSIMCREKKIECRNRTFFSLQRHAHQIVSSTLFRCWFFLLLSAEPRLLCHSFMSFEAPVPRLNIFVR